MTWSAVAGVGVAALLCCAAGSALAWPSTGMTRDLSTPLWAYTKHNGPGRWGELDPRYRTCEGGQRQSPIDLRFAVPAPRERLSFHYRSSPLSLVNNGRVVLGEELTGSYLIAEDRRYDLIQYGFHTPSEHLRNGTRAAMEIQFLHQDARGRRAVIAVLVDAGRRPNSILQRVADHLPPPGEVYYGRNMGINPIFMLPSDRAHFSYPGSLTVPPCTEGVQWLIMRDPIELDAGVIQRFRQATGPNARPVQAMNGRRVAFHRVP